MSRRHEETGNRPESTSARLIMEASIELFYLQGYSTTSLRQIAEHVGLQVGSLYNHIASKEQLLFSIMERSMLLLLDQSEHVLSRNDDSVEQVRAFIKTGIHFHASNRREALIGNTEVRALSGNNRHRIVALRDQYQLRLEELIQRAADERRLNLPDIKAAAYAGIAICVHVSSWYSPGGRLSLEELEEALVATYLPAVGLTSLNAG